MHHSGEFEPPSPRLATALMKVRKGQCRFIVSDPPKPTLFCGAPTNAPGSSWCEFHSRIVYAPARAVGGAW